MNKKFGLNKIKNLALFVGAVLSLTFLYSRSAQAYTIGFPTYDKFLEFQLEPTDVVQFFSQGLQLPFYSPAPYLSLITINDDTYEFQYLDKTFLVPKKDIALLDTLPVFPPKEDAKSVITIYASSSHDLITQVFSFEDVVSEVLRKLEPQTAETFVNNYETINNYYFSTTTQVLSVATTTGDTKYLSQENLEVLINEIIGTYATGVTMSSGFVFPEDFSFNHADGNSIALSTYLSINGIRLDDMGVDSQTSGASLIGVFDDFVFSNATSVQLVLSDFDSALESVSSTLALAVLNLDSVSSTIRDMELQMTYLSERITGNYEYVRNVAAETASIREDLNALATASSSDTLQDVTDNGNVTTNDIQFAGGTSTGDLNVQGDLVANSVSSTYALFLAASSTDLFASVFNFGSAVGTDLVTANATTTNLYASNLNALSGTYTNLDSTNITGSYATFTNMSVINPVYFQNMTFGNATGSALSLSSYLTINGIRLDDVGTSPTSSGAYLVGVFDEFANSNATTVQMVLNDFDTVLSFALNEITDLQTDLAVATSSIAQNTTDIFNVSTTVEGLDFQYVTDRGATTSNAIQFAGGTSTNAFAVEGSLTAMQVSSSYAVLAAVDTDDLFAKVFTFGSASGTSIITQQATTTQLFAENLTAVSAGFGSISGTNAVFTNFEVGNQLLFGSASGTSVTTTELFTSQFDAMSAEIEGLQFGNATGTNLALTNLTSAYAQLSQLEFGYATGTALALSSHLSVNGIQLDAVGFDNQSSGASLLGVFDEFVFSNATTTQAVLADFDSVLSSLSSDILTLQTDLASVSSTVALLEVDVQNVSSTLAQTQIDLQAVSSTVASNTTDITNNQNSISNNASSILTNQFDIADLETDLAVATSSIAQNATDIANVSTTLAGVDLQYVTDNGSLTTNAIQFAGGTSTGALYLQSLLNVTGLTTLSNLVFTNATGTNLALTNSLSIGGIQLSATGINNLTSGATLVGVFDEFVNSNGTTVQQVLADLDTVLASALTDIATNQTDISNLQTDLANATSSIATNAADIASVSSTATQNASDIVNNANAIVALDGDIVAVSSTAAQNTLDITSVSTTVANLDLQDVTDNGSITTNALQFAGGTSTAGLVIQSTLSVAGLASLNNLLFAAATGTALELTDFLSVGGVRLDATGVNKWTSGASLVGVFDEFTYSNATTVQGVLADLDAAIANVTSTGGGGSQDLQGVTNLGNVTTNTIQFAGGTSTGDFDVQGDLTAGTVSTTELWINGQKIEVSPNIFQATQAVAFNDSTNNNWESITLNSDRKDSYYTHSNGNSTVTITATGTYRVSGHVTFDMTADLGGERSASKTRIYKNNSTAISAEIFAYSRLLAVAEETATIPAVIVDLNAGDVIELQAAKHTGASTIVSLSSSLLIEAVTIGGASAGGSTQTLQEVTDQGSITTNALQFAGGTSTASLYIQSMLSVTGLTTLSNLVFGNATGTNLELTNSLSIGGISLSATGINNLTSGATLVGVFDEFVNSNGTTVQAVLADFDGLFTSLSNQIAGVQSDLASATSSIATLQTDLASATSSIAQNASDISDLQTDLGTVSTTVANLDLQDVTDNGFTTTNALEFAGGTSTGDFGVQGNLSASTVSTTELWINGQKMEVSPNIYQGSQSTAFSAVNGENNVWKDVLMNSSRKDSYYTHTNGNSEVTITATGTYRVSGHVTFNMTVDSGSDRSSSKARIYQNNSTVISPVVYAYSRNTDQGEGTAAIVPFVIDLDVGDVLELQAAKDTGESTIVSLNSSLLIEAVTIGGASSGGSTPTLQQVTDQGFTTTNVLEFAGGTSTSDFAVSSQFVVQGSASLQGVSATNVTTTDLVVNGLIGSDLMPKTNDQYYLGDATHRWMGLWATNVTTTNLYATNVEATNVTTTDLYASGVVSTTQLFVNGVEITGGSSGAQNLQDVTDQGKVTTNDIQFAGGTSTGDFYAEQSLSIGTFPAMPNNQLCYDGSGGSFIGMCVSLQKYKENSQNLTLGLDAVLALTPREFDWVSGMGGQHDLGFIAEEVEAINPLLASYDDGELVGVKYDVMTALLTQAVQEQYGMVKPLLDGVSIDPAYTSTTPFMTVNASGQMTIVNDLITTGTVSSTYATFMTASSTQLYAETFNFNSAVGAEFVASNATTTNLFATNLEATNFSLSNLDFEYATGTGLALSSYLTINGIQLDEVGTSNDASGASLIGAFDEFANSNADTVQGVLADFDSWITTNATTIAYAMSELGAATSTMATIISDLNSVSSTLATALGDITSLQSDLAVVSSTVAGFDADITAVSTTASQNVTDIAVVSSTLAGLDLQSITDNGALTTNGLQFAGGTSTADFVIQGSLEIADLLTVGGISLDSTGNNRWTSGASLVGVFDEFGNSSATSVQGVLADLDAAITANQGGGSGGSFDGRVDDTMTIGAAPERTETTWQDSNLSGSGYNSVRSLKAYKGHLYAGRGDGSGDGDVYICDATNAGHTGICDNAADWSVSFDTSREQVITLHIYNGFLYAGFGTGSGDGDVYYCNPGLNGDPDICESGDWQNAYFPSGPYNIRELIEYEGYLYAANDRGSGDDKVGICNPAAAGNVNICDNSSDWSNISLPESGYEEVPTLAVFNNRLYAFTGDSTDDSDFFACDPTKSGDDDKCDSSNDWKRVLSDPINGLNSYESAAVYDGHLYLGAGRGGGDGDLHRCSPDRDKTALCDDNDDIERVIDNREIDSIPAIAVYDGRLFLGYQGSGGEGDIVEYQNGVERISHDTGSYEATYAFADFNGYLYAGRGNGSDDGEVWYYQTARESSYNLAFEAGNATGSVWFDSEAYSISGEGSSEQVGAFKFSHGIITEAGAYDLAEMYPTHDETMEAGDVVAIDEVWEGYMRKSTKPYDKSLAGVVSTNPGFLLSGPKDENTQPIALVGRVPVKITLEGGPIKPGDPLTSASYPGYAMKATKAGTVIGQAMESFSSSTISGASSGTVMMFVQTGYFFGTASSTMAIDDIISPSSTGLLMDALGSYGGSMTLLGGTTQDKFLINTPYSAESEISIDDGDAVAISADLKPGFDTMQYYSFDTDDGKATILSTDNSDLYLMPEGDEIVLRPLMDSTTGIRFMNSAGDPVMNVDTVNNFVGIGTDAPLAELDVRGEIIAYSLRTNKIDFGAEGGPSIGFNDSNNDLELKAATSSNVAIYLGDEAGATEFKLLNSNGDTIASYDSEGNTSIGGRLGVGVEEAEAALHVKSYEEENIPVMILENKGGKFEMYRLSQSPEGIIKAHPGDMAVDSEAGTMYIKQTGDNTTTGWVKLATGSPLYEEMDTLASITARGATTTESLVFGGGTSTGVFHTDSLSIGSSTWDLFEDEDGALSIGEDGMKIDSEGKASIGVGSAESKLSIFGKSDDLMKQNTGLFSTFDANITGSGDVAYGMRSKVVVRGAAGASNELAEMAAFEAEATNDGGQVGKVLGAELGIQNLHGGTIQYATGLMVKKVVNSMDSKIHHLSGVTIEEQYGAVNRTNLLIGTSTIPAGQFSIYNVSTSTNFFAGNLGIGVVAPEIPLAVASNGGLVAAFNRLGDDGKLLAFEQNGVEEATIAIYGNTVSYNAFTGSLYAWTEDTLDSGMLVTLTGTNKLLHNDPNSQVLYGVTASVTANDQDVIGAYLSVLEPKLSANTSNPYLVMMEGKGEIWVAQNGEDIEVGDYLLSSSIAGHAMKDSSEEAVSHVIARAVESVIWSEVETMIKGVKHTKIAVFFDRFSRNNLEHQIQNSVLGIDLQGAEMDEDIPDLLVAGAQFEGTISVKGHVTLSRDSVGQALLMVGEQIVHIDFEHDYETLPIVTVTPVGIYENIYGVQNVSLQGFDIILKDKTYEDMLFNWHAFANNEGKVFVTNGTTMEIEINDMGGSVVEAMLLLDQPIIVEPVESFDDAQDLQELNNENEEEVVEENPNVIIITEDGIQTPEENQIVEEVEVVEEEIVVEEVVQEEGVVIEETIEETIPEVEPEVATEPEPEPTPELTPEPELIPEPTE